MRLFRHLGFILLGLALLSCSAPASVQDQSLVTGTPCTPPCWYEITPGSTDALQAQDILKDIAIINPVSVRSSDRSLYDGTDGAIDWEYMDASGPTDGGFLMLAGPLVKWHQVFYPHGLRLADIIDTLGEPDVAWVGSAGGGGNHYVYRFAWQNRGLLLESMLYAGNSDGSLPQQVPILPEMKISQGIYFPPQSMGTLWTWLYGASEVQSREIAGQYAPWPGLGGKLSTSR